MIFIKKVVDSRYKRSGRGILQSLYKNSAHRGAIKCKKGYMYVTIAYDGNSKN